MKTKPATIETIWECWTYDVWGNERDGYEVNDRSCIARAYPLTLPIEWHNRHTEHEFTSAYPSDRQIREAFGLKRIQLDLDGDDISIYINHASTGYPIGEMLCTSHTSLSPIKEA